MMGTATKAGLVAAAAVLLVGCYQSYQDVADGGADGAGDIDASACDGTWRDPTTGYLWENPPSNVARTGDDARGYCNALTLCGYSTGSWHLPTITESRSLIRGCPATMTGGACGVTDECLDYPCWSSSACAGCSYFGGPGAGGCYWDASLGGTCGTYRSSLAYYGSADTAWEVPFNLAYVGSIDESSRAYARCVHRGP